MSYWKNGLLLMAGTVVGLTVAAWLESETHDCNERQSRKADGMELLVKKVRREAKWAMEECINDEQREKVYAEVSASIRELQTTLQQRGEEIIADLKKQSVAECSADDDEEFDDNPTRKFKSSMEDLTKALNETLEAIKPLHTV
ncbi:MAG: hypothetical protein K6G55_04525 [Selenomonadaceae bacterium]|nr:hypothetical protein [Selenomonadaceae bacterium]